MRLDFRSLLYFCTIQIKSFAACLDLDRACLIFLQTLHISSLPFEVLIAILKWVVSSDLDLRSLELCSQVCRGFYLAARSNDIWKPVCLRTWGFDKMSLDVQVKRGTFLMTSQKLVSRNKKSVKIKGGSTFFEGL